MRTLLNLIIPILFLSLATKAIADNEITIEPTEDKFHPLTMFLLLEGMFAANAWLASENPNAYGAVTALLFPLAAGEGSSSNTTKWVGFVGAESIALYNLNIDEDKESKSEIFKNNMLAWHLFAGAVGLTGYIMGDYCSKKSLSLIPTPAGGAQLVYNYKF